MPSAIHCTAEDLWKVAQACWGEARGEAEMGRIAVAYVIRNRRDFHARWKNKSLYGIATAPYQFSCFNVGDPNKAKLDNISVDDEMFCSCLLIAISVISGKAINPIGYSTHYFALGSKEPGWAKYRTAYSIIGNHQFYQGIA